MNITKDFFRKLKRAFSGLRLIDIIIISIGILVIIATFIFLFRRASYIVITVKAGEDSIVWPRSGIPSWYLGLLKKGLIEKDLIGRPHVEILDVYSYPSPLTDPNKNMLFITLKIRAVYSKSTNSYVFNSRPVQIGNTIRISPGNILIDGLITNIEGIPDSRIRKTVRANAQMIYETAAYPSSYGVYPYLAESIEVGDEVKDSKGETIIKIVAKRVEDAKRTVVTDSGKTFIAHDPLKKDVYLTLELKVTQLGNDYYLFDDLRLVTGLSIPIQLPKRLVYATITNIEDSGK